MCEHASQVKSTNVNVLWSEHREIFKHYQLSVLRRNKNKTLLSSAWLFSSRKSGLGNAVCLCKLFCLFGIDTSTSVRWQMIIMLWRNFLLTKLKRFAYISLRLVFNIKCNDCFCPLSSSGAWIWWQIDGVMGTDGVDMKRWITLQICPSHEEPNFDPAFD